MTDSQSRKPGLQLVHFRSLHDAPVHSAVQMSTWLWTGLPGVEVLSGPTDWILCCIRTYLYLLTNWGDELNKKLTRQRDRERER